MSSVLIMIKYPHNLRSGSLATCLFIFLSTLPSDISTIPLEAAFQGRCENGNPCDQTCFNLHDFMYECDCNEGYYLHSNGYNCIAFNTSESEILNSGNTLSSESEPNIAIQIEVDIEPPEEEADGLSKEQLEKLGLPSHHIHYKAGLGKKSVNDKKKSKEADHPSGTELLAPEDIQVSYTVNEIEPEIENQERYNTLQVSDSRVNGVPDFTLEELDPPRALPSSLNVSSKLKDNIYDVDAFCNLKCGDGICHIHEVNGKRDKKCLCPLGWGGETCQSETDIEIPKLSGHGHIALPTLQNAYSDLHMSFDFKPESWTGILLLTGETDDMTGDYLALLLRDGYVELRLDCGTGPGVVKSSTQVHLHEWNHLSVFRHDWGVWIQLNGGKQEEGRSQGLFSRITFNQPVFIGGSGTTRNVKNFLGVDNGIQACVRHLEINDKLYNLKPSSQGGDIIGGLDISTCDDISCTTSPCQQGQCRMKHSEETPYMAAICECPLGFSGESCQHTIDIKVPKFDGTSYLRYPGLGEAALIWLEIELVFRPTSKEGLLLYNGNRNDGQGDFMAIFLNQGFVEFAFDLGNGITIARSVQPVGMGDWHNLTVSRTGREVFLSIDSQRETTIISAGAFTQLSLDQNLWLGSVPDYNILSAYLPITQAYEGCIQKVIINGLPVELISSALSGVNVENCDHACLAMPCGYGQCKPQLDGYTCECPLGWGGNECQTRVGDSFPTPSFSGSSYLLFNNPDLHQNLIGNSNSINLRVRVTSSHGLLLWAGGQDSAPSADFIMIGINAGFVQFSYNLGSGEVVLEYNSTRIDDGLWHRIRATRLERTASLMVDNGEVITGTSPGKLRQLNARAGLFLGGADDLNYLAASRYKTGLVGCVAELSIGNMVNINMLHKAEKGKNIDTCPHKF